MTIIGYYAGEPIEAPPADVVAAFRAQRCPDCCGPLVLQEQADSENRALIVWCGLCDKHVALEPWLIVEADEEFLVGFWWARWRGALPAPGGRMPGTLG